MESYVPKNKYVVEYMKSVDGLSESSLYRRRRTLKEFFEYIKMESAMGEEEVDFGRFYELEDLNGIVFGYEQIDAPFVQNFIDYREKAGDSPRILQDMAGVLRDFFNYLVKQKILEYNPAKNLDLPKVPSRIHHEKYLTEEECWALLAATHHSEWPERDFCIILTFLVSGLRISELCDLTMDDINYGAWLVRIDKTKCYADTSVMTEVLKENIQKYRNAANFNIKNAKYVFCTEDGKKLTPKEINNIIKDLVKKAGIKKPVTSHWLRHTMATILAKEGVQINYIQSQLRHRNLNSTMKYTHLYRDEEMKEVLENNPLVRGCTQFLIRKLMASKPETDIKE